MTAGRTPVDHPRVQPLFGIPFDAVLAFGLALAVLFTAWSIGGRAGAYGSIGSGGLSLDVPMDDREPADRGGPR